ncbi:MAG: sulfite exporter TauE/SafE family protein [Gammaproteobacteria bacterium]|nr:sulfite exporter TauE/SafE family protein [Gammaproteobacteria bacterium]
MLAFPFGIIIGLALGLTGGGGSIFAVPLLIYGLGVEPHDAIGMSLVVVALVSAFGAAGGLRAKLVEYRAGLVFAAAGMLTAPLGVKLANQLSEGVILTAFATLMVLVAASMWQRASRRPDAAAVVRADFVPEQIEDSEAICRINPDQKLHLTGPCSMVLALSGGATGVLAGLFGVGGGFLIVPALTFVTELEIHRAVATSLLVITLIGLAGAAAVVLEGRSLPWALTGMFVAGGFLGMILGHGFARRIAGPRLQKFFAAVMVVIGLFVLASRGF